MISWENFKKYKKKGDDQKRLKRDYEKMSEWRKPVKKSSNYKAMGNNRSTHNFKADTTWLYFIAGLAFLFYFVKPLGEAFKGFVNMLKGAKDPATVQAEKDSQTYVDSVAASFDWSNVPNTPNYYLGVANTLEYAMQGWGTDEDTIFTQLNGRSADEIKAIFIKFGNRENTDFSNELGNLCKWLRWELSGSDLNNAISIMGAAGLTV